MNRNLKNTDKHIQNSESKFYFDLKNKKTSNIYYNKPLKDVHYILKC